MVVFVKSSEVTTIQSMYTKRFRGSVKVLYIKIRKPYLYCVTFHILHYNLGGLVASQPTP